MADLEIWNAVKPLLTTKMQASTDLAAIAGMDVETARRGLTYARCRGLVTFDHWHGADWFYAIGTRTHS